VRSIYSLHATNRPIREIARTLGIARNTVRKYVRADGLPKPKLPISVKSNTDSGPSRTPVRWKPNTSDWAAAGQVSAQPP